jgi:hypothetical protein
LSWSTQLWRNSGALGEVSGAGIEKRRASQTRSPQHLPPLVPTAPKAGRGATFIRARVRQRGLESPYLPPARVSIHAGLLYRTTNSTETDFPRAHGAEGRSAPPPQQRSRPWPRGRATGSGTLAGTGTGHLGPGFQEYCTHAPKPQCSQWLEPGTARVRGEGVGIEKGRGEGEFIRKRMAGQNGL